MTGNHQLINQDSGNFEYYTPVEIVDLAREAMGKIDLDPASSDIANLYVNANQYYTIETDGLSQKWFGNVWLNPPFSRGENPCPKDRDKCKKKTCIKRGYHIDHRIPSTGDWVDKLLYEYNSGRMLQACVITFANTSESWAQKLLEFPVCFPRERVAYYDVTGQQQKDVPKGSMITYLGPHALEFEAVFNRIGRVKR